MDFSTKAKVRNAAIARVPVNPPVIPDPSEPPKERKGKDQVIVLRIDPNQRIIARMSIEMTTEPKSAAAEVARLCRTNRAGSQDLGLNLFGFDLLAAGGVELDPSLPGWKIRGQGLDDDTTGIGLLFARGPNGGMISLSHKFSMGWARDNVIWTDGTPEEEA